MDVVKTLWTVYNDNLRHWKNKIDKVEEECMAEKIKWHGRNKHKILSARDQLLAHFDVTQVHKMKQAQKSEWIRQLT